MVDVQLVVEEMVTSDEGQGGLHTYAQVICTTYFVLANRVTASPCIHSITIDSL